MNIKNIFEIIVLIFGIFILSCFHGSIIHPVEVISIQQYKLIWIVFFAMSILVIPVILMTLFFVYNYQDNKMNTYRPDWSHSVRIELIIWTVPIIIILFLGFIAWNTSHQLDPRRRIVTRNQPIVINVVALNWRWLFIYPHEKIATINEIVIPDNTPVIFNITSHSVMSAFFIPRLGSQVYAMPKMFKHLNLIAKFPGKYNGFSSNYNGAGFSNMKFRVIVVPKFYTFYKWKNHLKKFSHALNNFQNIRSILKLNTSRKIEYFYYYDTKLLNYVISCK
ncbi:ubiquinol oxidase subunit II [Buchnera aphidicola]|uniref:ubiquinol oxidase subunit II n=1 Tax=Buchnera aphidicola TaxID=9 RepID=UPI0031B87B90